jgi:predicted class III extradiol MEMO1 family dioxygenase
MIKKVVLALAFSSATLSAAPSAVAAPTEKVASDPAQLKLAEQLVLKLVPPGTYEKMMKDMATGDFIQQIMGMDMSSLAAIAGEKGADVAGASGKSLMELAAETDPNFKERMDITMKVMFTEMGAMMNKIEPEVRTALSEIYARKYTAQQLTDMNVFFATPSGNAFATNFMSTFTDKEMIDASMKMVPVMVEGMPDIMKKVEAATAHLPPLPTTESEAVDIAATSDEMPWYNRDNWTAADRKKIEALEKQSEGLYIKAAEASEKAEDARFSVMAKVEKEYLAKGWKVPTPEPSPYDDEGRAELSKGWSKEDNEAIAALTAVMDEAEEKSVAASRSYGRSESMVGAAYRQAMINAGQDKDGTKRSIAEAVEEAGRDYDSSYEGAAEGAAAAGDAAKASIRETPKR